MFIIIITLLYIFFKLSFQFLIERVCICSTDKNTIVSRTTVLITDGNCSINQKVSDFVFVCFFRFNVQKCLQTSYRLCIHIYNIRSLHDYCSQKNLQ